MTASTWATNSCSSCSAPIDSLRKAAEVNPSPWAPASHPCVADPEEALAPGFGLALPWLLGLLGEWIRGWKICLCLFHSPSFSPPSYTFKEINTETIVFFFFFYRIGHFKETTHTQGIHGKLTYFTSIFPTNFLKFPHTLLLCTSRCLKGYGKCEHPIHINSNSKK